MPNCIGCGVTDKKLSKNKDGKTRCAKCANAWRNREYRKRHGRLIYERNREKIIENAAKWNRENPEKRKKITKRYEKAHKKERTEAAKDYQRERYHSDPEYRKWRKIHSASHSGSNLAAYIDDCLIAHPYCAICASTDDLTVDHLVPIAKGGKAAKDNVQTLCRSCNSFKQDKIFLADNQGFLVGV
jgi:5-methylcytosine-specific restriction endonuclease McrA